MTFWEWTRRFPRKMKVLESPHYQARGSVVGPWALAGLLGAILYSVGFNLEWSRTSDGQLGMALVVLTPIVAGAFGWVVTRHARQPMHTFSAPLAFAAALVAGLVNGALIGGGAGAIYEFPSGILWGLFGGALAGLVASFPFLIPLTMMANAAAACGRAREGSIVDRSDRRVVWAVIPPFTAMGAFLADGGRVTMTTPTGIFGLHVLIGVCVYFSVAFVVLEARSWLRARREIGAVDDGRGPVIDVGVGDETVDRTAEVRLAYREIPQETKLFRGDPHRAAWLLRQRALRLVVGVVVSVASLWGALMQKYVAIEYPVVEAPPVPGVAFPPIRVLYTHAEGVPASLAEVGESHVAYVRTPGNSILTVDYKTQKALEPTADLPPQRLAFHAPLDADNPATRAATNEFLYVDGPNLVFETSPRNTQVIGKFAPRWASFAPKTTAFAFTLDNTDLYLGSPNTAPTRALTGVVGAPIYTELGVYALQLAGEQTCLVRADSWMHSCVKTREAAILADADRKSFVVCFYSDHSDCNWYDPGGAQIGDMRFDGRFAPKALNGKGLLVGTNIAGETIFASIPERKQHVEPTLFDVKNGRWGQGALDGSKLVGLRQQNGAWDIVELDVARLITPSP